MSVEEINGDVLYLSLVATEEITEVILDQLKTSFISLHVIIETKEKRTSNPRFLRNREINQIFIEFLLFSIAYLRRCYLLLLFFKYRQPLQPVFSFV